MPKIRDVPAPFKLDLDIQGGTILLEPGKEVVVVFFSGRFNGLTREDGSLVKKVMGSAGALAIDELGLKRDTFPGISFTLLSSCQ